MRSHTVILGAGAIAAIPDGDKTAKVSSVMNGLLKTKFRRNSCSVLNYRQREKFRRYLFRII